MRNLLGNVLLATATIICLGLLSQAVRCNLKLHDMFFSRNPAAQHLVVLGLCIVGLLLASKWVGRR